MRSATTGDSFRIPFRMLCMWDWETPIMRASLRSVNCPFWTLHTTLSSNRPCKVWKSM